MAQAKRKTKTSKIKIEKAGVNIGAFVTDIDLSRPLSDADAATLLRAHGEHELLIFPDQHINSEQFMAFGRRMGDLTVHPFSPNADDAPELIIFDNDEDNPPYGTDIFHSDETFRNEPPMGTMLHSLEVPKVGGDTVFSSMTSAYEGLSDRMKDMIAGLVAIHDFKVFRGIFPKTEEGKQHMRMYEDLYPMAEHPVVSKHPVTGKPVLFVNPQFTIAIKGMPERESRDLLDHLFYQALVPEYQYRHNWGDNMVIFWDNRACQHYAVHDYFPQRRYLERVTVKGTAPVPYFKPADEKTLRSNKKPDLSGAKNSTGGHKPKRPLERQTEAAE